MDAHERVFKQRHTSVILCSDRLGVDATVNAVDPDWSTLGVEGSKIAAEATEVRRSASQACA